MGLVAIIVGATVDTSAGHYEEAHVSNLRRSKPTAMRETPGADIVIAGVSADGLSESVTIVNRGEIAQPLTGWAVVSLHGQEVFEFPEGTTLPAGGRVRVLSGEQAQPAPRGELLWSHENVWSNHSDTALLFDQKGHEVNRFTYPQPTLRTNRRPKRKILDQDREGFHLRDWDEALPQDRD